MGKPGTKPIRIDIIDPDSTVVAMSLRLLPGAARMLSFRVMIFLLPRMRTGAARRSNAAAVSDCRRRPRP